MGETPKQEKGLISELLESLDMWKQRAKKNRKRIKELETELAEAKKPKKEEPAEEEPVEEEKPVKRYDDF